MARKCKGCKGVVPGAATLPEMFGMSDDVYLKAVETHIIELSDRLNPNNYTTQDAMLGSVARYFQIPETKDNLLKVAALFSFMSALIQTIAKLEKGKTGSAFGTPEEMPSMFR